ncbi:hypothetical protein VDG1235_1775 [Verrucomicrobiia bacterium DG1235]|nr:hypothetical protein VDG1235_1775 [Verrucomicrobiae bacterium DG1235]
MNIFELNSSLAGSLVLDRDEFGQLVLERYSNPEGISGLSVEQTVVARRILDRIGELVPDDVDFSLRLDGVEPVFSLSYDDGNAGVFPGSIPFETDEELYQRLLERDWDDFRSSMLGGTNLFDEMLEIAKKRPSRIPSTKTLRRFCKEQIKDFRAQARREKLPYHFMMIFEEDDGPDFTFCEGPKNREEFLVDLSERMQQRWFLVAVCIDGRAIATKDVERIKLEALELLPPISRAQAEGRWPYDLMPDSLEGF